MVCTGNAARSVMAGVMLQQLAEEAGTVLDVRTGGTHAVPGQPASRRTRDALAMVLTPERAAGVNRHRSRPVEAEDVAAADLLVAMEADHVRYVRTHFACAAARTATIRRLCRDLPPGASGTLPARLEALDLAQGEPDPADDVIDPAGCELEAYVACAQDLQALTSRLLARL